MMVIFGYSCNLVMRLEGPDEIRSFIVGGNRNLPGWTFDLKSAFRKSTRP